MSAIDIAVLRTLYPFESMLEAHLNQMCFEGEVRDLKRGETVFEAGANDGESIFLLSGRLHARYTDGREREIDADSDRNKHAVGDFQPRRYTATVISAAARVLAFDRVFVEKVLTWDQISRSPQFTVMDGTADNALWVFRMLRSKALLRLPAGNLQRIFERFEAIGVPPGEVVIREGEEGDYFYVIKEGELQVIKDDKNGVPQVVAHLGDGDSFGEDALISDAKRNATVEAVTAARLMRLSKSDFGELMRHPVVDWVTPGQTSALMGLGAGLVDVRMDQEYDHRSIKGSFNAPLYRIREEMNGRPTEIPYVVYCDTGERSASAAFILNKLGYTAYALRGGIMSVVRLLSMTGAGRNL